MDYGNGAVFMCVICMMVEKPLSCERGMVDGEVINSLELERGGVG